MKTRKDIYFHNEDIEFINKIAKENNIKTFAGSLSFIINEYRKYITGSKDDYEKIAKEVNDEFDRRHKNELVRIRLASSISDKNVQILTEMINTLFINNNITDFFDSEIIKAPALEQSQSVIKSRIEKYKQVKDDKGNK